MSDDAPPADGGRRRFLKIATCALGGGMGAAVVVPAARYLLYPVDEHTVTAPDDPIDTLAEARIRPGAPPTQVALVVPNQRDAWGSVADVPIGSAWLLRGKDGALEVYSSVCPHLGCSIGFDAGENNFLCPCHKSRFDLDGKNIKGPAERGMDPLPFEVKDGRIRITWVRYRVGGSTREKV